MVKNFNIYYLILNWFSNYLFNSDYYHTNSEELFNQYFFMKSLKILVLLSCIYSKSLAHTKDTIPIEFLSDLDKVYKLLEVYQAGVYRTDTHAYRWQNTPEQKRLLDSVARHYLSKTAVDSLLNHLLKIKLPTRYEDIIPYWILTDATKRVEAQLKAESTSFIHPHLGTLPTSTLNAYTNRFYPDSPLIIINSGLFGFCHELIKIAFKTIAFSANKSKIIIGYSNEDFDSILNNNQDLIVRFSMALEDYANNRRIIGQAPPDTLQSVLGMELVSSMEFFVIAHEYGHMILHHMPIGQLEPELKSAVSEGDFEVGVNSWKQEIEADIFGNLLLAAYIKSHHSVFDGILQLAPYIYFRLAQVADESVYIMRNKILPGTSTDDSRRKITQIIFTLAKNSFPLVKKSFINERFHFTTSQINFVDTPFKFSENHPPNWVRGELMKAITKQNNITHQHVFDSLGSAFVNNLQKLWDIIKEPWVKIINNDTVDKAHHTENNINYQKEVDSLGKIVKNFLNGDSTGIPQSFLHFMDSIRRVDEPETCDYLLNQGKNFFEEKKYKEGIEYLSKAEKCGVKSSVLYFCLASCYLDIGDNIDAIKYYTLAINKEQPNVYYWNYGNRAIAYRNLGKDSLSLDDFTKALEMTQNPDAKFFSERAALYSHMGNYNLAIKDYHKSIEQDPNNIEYLPDLFEAYTMNGDYQIVVSKRSDFLNSNPSKGYLLLLDFFEYTSRLQLGLKTDMIEKQISSLLKSRYNIIWHFEDFNRSLPKKDIKPNYLNKILTIENEIKQHISKSQL